MANSLTVTIGGTTYNLPVQGVNPPWGNDLSDIVEALIDIINTLSGTGDVNTTNFSILNNTAVATNVTGLSFDTATVRSAIIEYSIFRSTNSTVLAESGQMQVVYNGSSWDLARGPVTSDAGVTLTITNGGQIQYTSTNVSGTSYAGLMKFRARATTQS